MECYDDILKNWLPELHGARGMKSRRPFIPSPAEIPSDMRPRERLCREGPGALSDKELLAILLNTGVKGKNVFELAVDILELLESRKETPDVKELRRLTGMGEAKSCVIAAMLEFGRRRWGIRGVKIRHPGDVYPLLRHYAELRQEHFIGVSLNAAHEVIATRVVTVGLVDKTITHPREVFADMIADRANAAIVAHNHPSGTITPSPEDDAVTERLSEAGKILGINLLDHVIFTDSAYYSYSLDGKLK
jgi:DNA repair protein RadC